MTYKEMLDKLAELEARVDLLERGQRKQTPFSGAPQFTPNTLPYPNPRQGWNITCETKGDLQ